MNSLNERAARRCDQLGDDLLRLRAAETRDASGARIFDFGVHALGGLAAGCALAEICMADLGRVTLLPAARALADLPAVHVATDHPVAACMVSQYAGWPVSQGSYFAMASGPMRALRGREPLLEQLSWDERAERVVGVLESHRLPTPDVCRAIAAECRVPPEQLTLLVAPTASLAGALQVVARSVETALHKLYELGFDLRRVVSGMGTAPLPPLLQHAVERPASDAAEGSAASKDLVCLGRTNDAILYGGEVVLWVVGDDHALSTYGAQVPSANSHDFGRPFLEIFEQYGRDFYKIDPLLFSPAVVTLVNLDTGRRFCFGEFRPDVLAQSFGMRG